MDDKRLAEIRALRGVMLPSTGIELWAFDAVDELLAEVERLRSSDAKWQQAQAAFDELQRLRAIEAAAREVTYVTPLDYIGGTWQCWYCTATSQRGEAPKEHDATCPWQALQRALTGGGA
jgi:hypothetical protein